MYIDITSVVLDVDTWPLSGSVSTHGPNAGPRTWAASMEEATRTVLLDTPEKLDALRDYMRGLGAWDDDEIDAWDAQHCNAMFLQSISLDMREMGMDDVEWSDEEEARAAWAEIEKRQEAGEIPSNIFRGDDGRFYFYLGI